MCKENKIVSIIVPVYNVEDKLKRCVESIRKQTYKDIEIILINDGSIDGSGSICDMYSKMDRRIHVSFMHSEMTVKEYQMRLALYDHLILLYEENKLPKKMIECMEIYMNHFDIWRKRGVIFEQKYIERNNEIVKKYICKTKGIPLQRKIKVIIKQSLKRLNQKNGIRE